MPQPLKPPALKPGDSVRIVSLSSPVEEERLKRGCAELARLGYKPEFDSADVLTRESFFAGSVGHRLTVLKEAFTETTTSAVFCTRGGYGSNYLLDGMSSPPGPPKILVGYSDMTSLQMFLWQKFRWVTFYGPMAAAGLDKGAGAPEGYDQQSLVKALTETRQGWSIDLQGESLGRSVVQGTLLGGCLTLIETALGTPWELDTSGSILVLEDRGMKPWQVDRAITHLRQAGKFRNVTGVILGEFPETDTSGSGENVKDIARRILGPLSIPIVFGVPVGHAARPMLTLPLGVWARLSTDGPPKLDILEPACCESKT
jgi:muramoyltetrapeptide carboxypeptidase